MVSAKNPKRDFFSKNKNKKKLKQFFADVTSSKTIETCHASTLHNS